MKQVLVITGGYLSAEDQSLWRNLRKQITQWKHSSGGWLELKIKANVAEFLGLTRLQARTRRDRVFKRFVAIKKTKQNRVSPPELTEVVLATALRDVGLTFDVAQMEVLFDSRTKLRQTLSNYECVFLSTTLIRDESELMPLIQRIRAAHPTVKLVLGGAYAGPLSDKAEAFVGVDGLAVGYGEFLIPQLAQWIRTGKLEAPSTGKLSWTGSMWVMRSGAPAGKDLDFLPAPDWALAEAIHGQKFETVHYESVRGCPYRCSFCNYPFLFDDSRFRFKSARKIADDWELYYKQGIKQISCLDSLFTMPKQRLIDLCRELIAREVKLQWSCYARASDLTDLETVRLMKQAGCQLVQIGFESGDPVILQNMNKRVTVEENEQALRICREAGLTSLISLIVGFPGETPESLEMTLASLRRASPDFFFVATFSTRAAQVPILSQESRARFVLETLGDQKTVSPYWKHKTMTCVEASRQSRVLSRKIIHENLSLEASSFYQAVFTYTQQDREPWLEFQNRAFVKDTFRKKIAYAFWNRFHAWVDRRLAFDFKRRMPTVSVHSMQNESVYTQNTPITHQV